MYPRNLSWGYTGQGLPAGQPQTHNFQGVLCQEVQQNNIRAVPNPPHQRANECGRLHDKILWVSVSMVVAFDDNIALQIDDGNKNSCGKELHKNSKARGQFQPHHSNVVRQNSCLPSAHKNEGRENKQHGEHLTICMTPAYQ
jgi:hypothetical protein